MHISFKHAHVWAKSEKESKKMIKAKFRIVVTMSERDAGDGKSEHTSIHKLLVLLCFGLCRCSLYYWGIN